MRTLNFRDTHIGLAHGNGGRLMRELIEELFVPALANPHLDTGADAVADAVAFGDAEDLPPPVPNRKYPPTARAATTHTPPVAIARIRTLRACSARRCSCRARRSRASLR